MAKGCLFQAETNSENAGVFLKQLRDQIKTLHAKFLRVEEEKTKIAVSYELEKKELKVNLHFVGIKHVFLIIYL